MATLEDVADILAELPGVTVGERWRNRTWFVSGKAFVWERPLNKSDIKRFGAATPPSGPLLAVRVENLVEKEAVLATASNAMFTIEHFEEFPALLIQLNAVAEVELREAIIDAWFACAPPDLAEDFKRQEPAH